MKPDIQGALHVLVVHFNTPDLTAQLITAFPRETPKGRPVYINVLDNSSTPQNLLALRANIEGLPGVTLDISDQNIGFGEGINQLATRNDIDDTDTLWLLNPDTQLRPNCLQMLEEELDSIHFDIVSPLIITGDAATPRIWYCGGSISIPDLRVRHNLYGSEPSHAPRHAFETDFVTGAAPMLRAATFRTIGGFPNGYFLYWEDAYFSQRARDLGYRLGVVPSAYLWHHVGASSGSGQSHTFYYWSTRNRFFFAFDVGLPRHRLMYGRGGVESLRPIGKALSEREARFSKAAAAVRGTLAGLRRASVHRA